MKVLSPKTSTLYAVARHFFDIYRSKADRFDKAARLRASPISCSTFRLHYYNQVARLSRSAANFVDRPVVWMAPLCAIYSENDRFVRSETRFIKKCVLFSINFDQKTKMTFSNHTRFDKKVLGCIFFNTFWQHRSDETSRGVIVDCLLLSVKISTL